MLDHHEARHRGLVRQTPFLYHCDVMDPEPPALAVGHYRIRMDSDGAIRLPSQWWPLFCAGKAPEILLLPTLKSCVKLVPRHRADKAIEAMKRVAADEALLSASDPDCREAIVTAAELGTVVRIGAQGQLRIPREIIDHLGLTSEVVLAGCFDEAELWGPAAWQVEEPRRREQG